MSDLDTESAQTSTKRSKPHGKNSPDEKTGSDRPQVVVVPDPVVSKPEPDAQVFSRASRFRPITLAFVAATVVFLSYGLFAIASILYNPTTALETAAPPSISRIPVATTSPATAATACETVRVSTFMDFDGNAVRSSAEPAAPPVRVAFRGPDGTEIFAAETNDSGELVFRLESPLPLSAHPESGAERGLWPGARLGAAAAGSVVMEGPVCEASLPFVWTPQGAETPRVGWAYGSTPPAGLPHEASTSLTVPSGGVQIAGRVYTDTDGDNIYSLADAPTSGVLVQLFDESETELARVLTGASGIYSFANLEPRTIHVVRIGTTAVSQAHAIGWVAENPSNEAFVRTGDVGLTVWGVDFLLDPAQ